MIEIQQLCKRFDAHNVVDGVTLTIEPGQVLGFLGPNGAGKSTTMKMITGFLAPTSGAVRVCGHDVASEPLAVQSAIGYLPEGAPLYEDMTVAAFLGFIAEVRGLTGASRAGRIRQVVSVMELEGVLGQRIETLSKGFRRRVGLAQAIIHDPPVLILDEPTDGLDPTQKHHVREMIQGLSRDKIVIISTHILEEVAAVCNRAVIISRGRVVADCTPAELEAQSRFHHAVTLQLAGAISDEDAQSMFNRLAGVAGVEHIETDRAAGRMTIFPQGGNSIFGAVSDVARDAAWQVDGLYVERGRLDEVFRRITEEAGA